MTRYYLAFLALAGVIVLSTMALAQGMTRSHGCRTVEDAQTLANHLLEHEWLGYQELYDSLEAEDRCVGVLIPVPATTPPIWSGSSDTFDVGIFMLRGEISGTLYGLLLGRYTRLSGA